MNAVFVSGKALSIGRVVGTELLPGVSMPQHHIHAPVTRAWR